MNKPLWPYPGSRWWKFDFHTHTPASRDTYWARNNIDLSPEEWLLAYMAAEIDCVAVTDHNSGEWVDRLKDAYAQMKAQADAGSPPEGFRDLTIFPGVEVSVSGGFHLLAIFDPDATTRTITGLLGAAFYQDTDGDSDGVTRKGPEDVIQAVMNAKGIPIPAHADRPGEKGKGLLALRDEGTAASRLDANTILGILRNEHLLAVEWEDLSRQAPEFVRTRVEQFARVIGSDYHTFQGNAVPGSRYTWVKMGTPSLEGLRLALLDGPLSVRRLDRLDQEFEDPNRHAALVIEAIEVSQARYMGRSRIFKVELNPWLNAIIGGRGTGKSTLVEFLRIALRRDGELPKALADDFKKYRNVYQSRDDDGLLTQDSRFTVTYRKDRTRFRVQWSQRGDVEQPIEVQDENGVWKADEGDVRLCEKYQRSA